MTIWSQWSVNPDENQNAAPNGAPQGGFYFDDTSKTLRTVMAGIAEIGQGAIALASSLGSAAFASLSEFAATMTGGSVENTVNIDAGAIKRGTLALARIPQDLTGKLADGVTSAFKQTLYNWIYPVNRTMLWHTTDLAGSGLVWTGVTATWIVVPGSEDRVLVTAGTMVGASQGAGGTLLTALRQTSDNGAHDHGGNTADHTLTIAEIPSHTHGDAVGAGGAGTEGGGSIATSASETAPAGGGLPHSHGISGAPDHHHTFTFNPFRYGVVVVVRTA